MNRTLPLAFLATLSLALAACGNKGPLVRPAATPAPEAAPVPAPERQPSDLPPPPAPAEPAELPPPAPDAAPPADDGNG